MFVLTVVYHCSLCSPLLVRCLRGSCAGDHVCSFEIWVLCICTVVCILFLLVLSPVVVMCRNFSCRRFSCFRLCLRAVLARVVLPVMLLCVVSVRSLVLRIECNICCLCGFLLRCVCLLLPIEFVLPCLLVIALLYI